MSNRKIKKQVKKALGERIGVAPRDVDLSLPLKEPPAEGFGFNNASFLSEFTNTEIIQKLERPYQAIEFANGDANDLLTNNGTGVNLLAILIDKARRLP